MRKLLLTAAVLTGALVLAGQASAAEITVKMMDKGSQGLMAFEPATAKLKVGDTVRFVPASSGHNVESITGMLPDGATATKGAIGQEVVVKFTKPGVYGFRCVPHWGFGMAFVAKVGTTAPNQAQALAAVDKAPPLAKKRLAADFQALQ